MTPERLTASQAARAIADGTLTSEELVRACLARIAARDSTVKAWCWIEPDRAIAAAREADTVRQLDPAAIGPLHGVPVAVKDIIDTADLPTQHNSVLFRGYRPARDAACVGILRAAGAIVLGKTDTVEFASHGRHPVTRNPHDLARTPGGSSSGSAAAVADFMAPLALGTQTGGSVIRPASYCGAFAFKPTHGAVSIEGVKPFSPTLDTLGWFARSAEDLALVARVFEVVDGPVETLRAPRIGVCRTPYWEQAEPATRAALASVAERMAAAGATVVDRELGPELAAINDHKELIMRAEGRVAYLELERRFGAALSPGIVKRLAEARAMSRGALAQALDAAAAARVAFDRLCGDLDAILTPSVVGEAPPGLASTGSPIFNGLWTLLHVPIVNVPGPVGPSGLPVGVSLVGPRYADGRVLAAAMAAADALAGRPVAAAAQ